MERGWTSRLAEASVGLGLLIAASLTLTTGVAAQEAGDGAAAELRSYYSGNGFLNRQLYDLAADEYRVFLRDHPDHEKAGVARYGLAVSLFRLGEHAEAQTHLTKLHGLPDFAYAVEVAMVLGQTHLALGEHAEAAETFRGVASRHADHDLADDAAALRAEALYQAESFEQLEEPCTLLIERWPGSVHRERVELLRGLADLALEKPGQAADRFEQLQRRFPDGQYADQSALLLAQAHHRAGHAQRAAREYRSVIEDRGDAVVPDAMYGLGSLLHEQDEHRQACRVVDDLLERHPQHALVTPSRFLRGRASFELGDYEEATGFLTAVHENDGDLADEAAYWLAKCELRTDAPAAAARRLERAAKRFPQSTLLAEMTYDRAVALVRADRPDDALEVLASFRERFDDHPLAPDALHLTVLTEHQEGRYDRSLEQCRVFATRFPEHRHATAVAFVAAENLFLTGAYERAGDEYEQFLERYPEDEQVEKARFRLGMSLYQLGRLDDARPLLESVTSGRDTTSVFRPAVLALGDASFQQQRWAKAQEHLEAYAAMGVDQAAADDALLKLGLARQRQDDFDGALDAYETLVSELPDSGHRLQALFERGQALVGAERIDDAVAAFEQLLEQGGDSTFAPHALNHLAAIAMKRGEHVRAARFYAQVAEHDHGAAVADEALFQQGQALMAAERFDAADDVFGRLLSDHEQSERVPEAAALEAIALARQDKHDTALERLTAVERRFGERLEQGLRTSVAYEKAWCQRELGRVEEAAETYRAMIADATTGSLRLYGLLELAELEMEARRHAQAVKHLERLMTLGDDRTPLPADLREQATYQLGVCRYELGEHEEAADLLGRFLDTWPESDRVPSAGLLCGEALFNVGRHEAAVERLVPVVENHEQHEAFGPSLLRLGECLAVLQRWDDAEAAFTRYLDAFADSPLWYQATFGIGWARDNRGEPDRAIEAYRQVVDRHQGPTAARAQFQIGECLFAKKQYQEAARELLKVDILYAYPQWSAAAIYEAGRCFEELSNPVDARRHFRQVVEQHAGTQWAQLAAQRLEALSRTGLPGHSSR